MTRKIRRPGMITFWLWSLPLVTVLPPAFILLRGGIHLGIPFLGEIDLTQEAMGLVLVAGFLLWLFLSFAVLPILMSSGRRTKNRSAVAVVNILFGFTVIGWIIALLMSFSSNVDPPTYVQVRQKPARSSSKVDVEKADDAREQALRTEPTGRRRLVIITSVATAAVLIVIAITQLGSEDGVEGSATNLGGTLAYLHVSQDGTSAQVRQLSADGSSTMLIADEPYLAGFDISPNGIDIALSIENQIHVRPLSGEVQGRQLTVSGVNWDPTWSPDGSRIAFLGSADEGDRAIFIMSAAGTGFVELGAASSGPDWSPDGSQLVFESVDGQVTLINSDGSGSRQLTTRDTAWNPTWSPDGSRVAFWSRDEDAANIYVIGADGSNLTRLTNYTTAWAEFPIWSPDGSRIAFFLSPDDGGAHIEVMSADGSQIERLASISDSGLERIELLRWYGHPAGD